MTGAADAMRQQILSAVSELTEATGTLYRFDGLEVMAEHAGIVVDCIGITRHHLTEAGGQNAQQITQSLGAVSEQAMQLHALLMQARELVREMGGHIEMNREAVRSVLATLPE